MNKKRATLTLGAIAKPIPYYKDLRKFTGSVLSSILFQQLEYWFSDNLDGFYKFQSPPEKGHEKYRTGDSWVEELGFSKHEFRTAFDAIGVRHTSKSTFDKLDNKFKNPKGEEFYYCSYHDRQTGLTYYFRNHNKVASTIKAFLSDLIPVNKECQFTETPVSKGSEFTEVKDPTYVSKGSGFTDLYIDPENTSKTNTEISSPTPSQEEEKGEGEISGNEVLKRQQNYSALQEQSTDSPVNSNSSPSGSNTSEAQFDETEQLKIWFFEQCEKLNLTIVDNIPSLLYAEMKARNYSFPWMVGQFDVKKEFVDFLAKDWVKDKKESWQQYRSNAKGKALNAVKTCGGVQKLFGHWEEYLAALEEKRRHENELDEYVVVEEPPQRETANYSALFKQLQDYKAGMEERKKQGKQDMVQRSQQRLERNNRFLDELNQREIERDMEERRKNNVARD